MSARHQLDEVLNRVADGAHVDWDAEIGRAGSPDNEAVLRNLQVLAKLAATHRQPLDDKANDDAHAMPGSTRVSSAMPETWGRHRLIRQIGHGSFGTVYLARDEQLDREVALKLFRPDVMTRETIRAEGRALARVEHQNVLTVYGVEEHDGQLALCMKYIRGRTLDDIVRADGPMNADEALVVARAICAALGAVHHAGVLHRDVKARNVMRERQGHYVLMDFGAGVIQRPDGSSAGEITVGTPLYMAPELFENHPATRASDVYALGVLLYYLVTGEYPVAGRSVTELRAAHRAGRTVPLDDRRTDLPAGFVAAVGRALARDPERRPQSATELLRELEANRPATDTRRRAWLEVASIALVVLMSVGLTLLSGLLATRAFNRVIDRPDAFAHESFWDAWRIGVQAMVLPAVVGIVLVIFASATQLAASLVPAVPRVWNQQWTRLARAIGLTPPDYARAVAGATILGGLIGFALVWVAFPDVPAGYLGSLAVDPPDRFTPFTPGHDIRALGFRLTISMLAFAGAVAWTRARSLGASHQTGIPSGLTVAALGLVALMTVFAQAPYKLMTARYNEMPVGTVGMERCVLMGEEAGSVRVYCPAWPPPRVRSIPAGEVERRCGFESNVFTVSAATGCGRDTTR